MGNKRDHELENSIKELQEAAKKAAEYDTDEPGTWDIVKDILGLVCVLVLSFAWLMIMLLIVSFVSLGYFHFELRYMILASVLFALACTGVYARKKLDKYRSNRK